MMRNMPHSKLDSLPCFCLIKVPVGFRGFFLYYFRNGSASITPGKNQFPRLQYHPTQCQPFLCNMYNRQPSLRLRASSFSFISITGQYSPEQGEIQLSGRVSEDRIGGLSRRFDSCKGVLKFFLITSESTSKRYISLVLL